MQFTQIKFKQHLTSLFNLKLKSRI